MNAIFFTIMTMLLKILSECELLDKIESHQKSRVLTKKNGIRWIEALQKSEYSLKIKFYLINRMN